MVEVSVSAVERSIAGTAKEFPVIAAAPFVKFSHVLLQIEIPTKPFPADLTSEWFLIVVGVHVEGEVVYLMEGFRTYCTFISLFATVSQFMIFIVAFLMKPFSAVLTNEGFITGVDPRVGVQR